MRPRSFRRSGIAAAAVAALVVALAGCSLSSGGGGKTLTVGIWKGYGADLPWVAKQFKAETGATLKFEYIDSEQNLIDLMQKADGGIDVGLPNVQYIGQGIDKGLFHPLDTNKLSNYGDVYPRFAKLSELRGNGKLYGIPWTWGSTGLFYDDRLFPTAPTSLKVLWDNKYKGKVALTDDATVEVPTTALYLGENPQAPDMAKVAPALQKLKDNAKLLYSSPNDLATAITNGTAKLGIANSDGIGGIIGSGQSHLKYTIPSEGAVGWIDTWAISAKTKNLGLAYQWLNYMTGHKFYTTWADNPADSSPAPANEKVVESLSPSVQTRLQAYPDKISDLAIQLPEPAGRLQAWQDAWQKVKAG
jgi:spermidine/putrescine transport system substrate-binding protein